MVSGDCALCSVEVLKYVPIRYVPNPSGCPRPRRTMRLGDMMQMAPAQRVSRFKPQNSDDHGSCRGR